jgi:hypothetical protein
MMKEMLKGAMVAAPPRPDEDDANGESGPRGHAACFPVQNMFRVPLQLLREGQREVPSALPLEVKR